MMQKSHFAIALFFILIVLPFVNHKISFIVVALITSIIPDIDTSNSRVGRSIWLRFFQFFTKHRGIIHSFTFVVFLAFLVSLIFPILALPVFFGYAIHLLLDSLTVEGTKPFWPLKIRVRGFIRTNSLTETLAFFTFCFADILLIALFSFEILGF
jgi:membrane-bound metal-dependent hydrolase YbcI (DUF457 family)